MSRRRLNCHKDFIKKIYVHNLILLKRLNATMNASWLNMRKQLRMSNNFGKKLEAFGRKYLRYVRKHRVRRRLCNLLNPVGRLRRRITSVKYVKFELEQMILSSRIIFSTNNSKVSPRKLNKYGNELILI